MFVEVGLSILIGIIIGWLASQILAEGRQQKELKTPQLEAQVAQQAGTIEGLQKERDNARKEQAERDVANNERIISLVEEKAHLEERLVAEKAAIEQAKNSLDEKFGAIAQKALSDNNGSFLTLAKQELTKQQQDADSALGAKETAIANLLKPVGEALDKLQSATHELEVKREGAYGSVLSEIKNIQEAHQGLRRETAQLIQALRAPKVRGNWGQLQLERCIEFAGMVEHASFDLETTVRVDDTSLRPDCVVYLPNSRCIVIDVKTPFDAFLDATNATDEALRGKLLVDHAARVREHLGQLSTKAYWKQFKESPDFIVCFLPSEVLFSAALEQDPGLIEFGSNSNVILATPTTLIALLKAVAYGWQQMDVTRNAIAIREAGQKLYDKLVTTQDYFNKMGRALANTVSHFNNLVGCIEGRGSVFSQARRLNGLGIGQEALAEIEPLELVTRDLKGDDWLQADNLSLAANEEIEPQSIS